MMTRIKQFALLVLLVTVVVSWMVVGVRAIKKSAKVKEVIIPTTTFEVIDSVWYLSPGQINTLQVDYIYYAKTHSDYKFRTSRLMKVGDTVYFSKK